MIAALEGVPPWQYFVAGIELCSGVLAIRLNPFVLTEGLVQGLPEGRVPKAQAPLKVETLPVGRNSSPWRETFRGAAVLYEHGDRT
jgi:hypothetical protein